MAMECTLVAGILSQSRVEGTSRGQAETNTKRRAIDHGAFFVSIVLEYLLSRQALPQNGESDTARTVGAVSAGLLLRASSEDDGSASFSGLIIRTQAMRLIGQRNGPDAADLYARSFLERATANVFPLLRHLSPAKAVIMAWTRRCNGCGKTEVGAGYEDEDLADGWDPFPYEPDLGSRYCQACTKDPSMQCYVPSRRMAKLLWHSKVWIRAIRNGDTYMRGRYMVHNMQAFVNAYNRVVRQYDANAPTLQNTPSLRRKIHEVERMDSCDWEDNNWPMWLYGHGDDRGFNVRVDQLCRDVFCNDGYERWFENRP